MRRSLVFLASLAVLAVSCPKPASPPPPPPPPPEVDAGLAKAPPVEFPVPTARSTLSVFLPEGPDCEWRQLEPVAGTGFVLARFPGPCLGVRVAWSPDASRAVVWFDSAFLMPGGYVTRFSSKPGFPGEAPAEKVTERAFLVSTRRAEQEPLPLPSEPGLTVLELGIDAAGAVIALCEERLPAGSKGKVTSGAQSFDLASITEGQPVLVHALRREGAQWKRVETKLSSTGADSLGVMELEAHGKLGRRGSDQLAPMAQGDVVDGKEQARLRKLAPRGAEGQWIFLGAGGVPLYVWEISGEPPHTTRLIASGGAPAVLPGLGSTDGDLVAVRTSGPYALIVSSSVGTHPRLYELPGAKLLFTSDTARTVTFWPTTAKPERHER